MAGDCRVKTTDMDFGGLAEAVIVMSLSALGDWLIFLLVVAKQVGRNTESERMAAISAFLRVLAERFRGRDGVEGLGRLAHFSVSGCKMSQRRYCESTDGATSVAFLRVLAERFRRREEARTK